jgi:hypothetical protein
MTFPRVDPIPLPAPVWLFKLLEMLTVTLHFLAVQLLVGGLVIGTVWAFWARWTKRPAVADSAGVIAHRLPILMTYVINLGVPPLLFAQVLYGRAIYTSSILIGTWWISVIFLLLAGYSLIYVMASRAKRGKGWGIVGLVALLIVAKIAFIYSSNMTLMIRPEVWVQMYQKDALGLHLNRGDPTVLPRWVFMFLGGLTAGGVGLMFLGLKRALRAQTTEFLRRWGARLAAAGIVAQAGVACWVISVQPSGLRIALGQNTVYLVCTLSWLGLGAALAVVSFLGQAKAESSDWRWPAAAGGLLFLEIAVMAVIRGGIRDLTLTARGFDVWDRHVAANWVVVSAFFVIFVIGLAAVVWLGSVVARAEVREEKYA